MASSTISSASSGYGSLPGATVNPRYACYWLDSCRGLHELDQCSHWRRDLRGKLGIYYSPNGIYKFFFYDRLSSVNLKNNPTGCTTVHLLIYTIRFQGEIEILFGLKLCKEKYNKSARYLSLTFPSAKPRKRDEYGVPVACRAFEWITDQVDIVDQGLKQRFLYQDANVIYPFYLNNEHANTLTQNFIPNEELLSLHWFPLETVLGNLPAWKDYLRRNATPNELAQHERINPVGIQLGDYQLRSVTATCLMCIREHVPGGFQTFLHWLVNSIKYLNQPQKSRMI